MVKREGKRKKRLNGVTFEVLRHRLWSINDEQCIIAARMSGSPVVYEAYDFNSALLTPQGECLFVGIYVTRHAAAIDMVVKSVINSFLGDIKEGDAFITNDPWAGAVHQSDFVLVAPVFSQGEIVLWTGVTMHEVDVGGPVPGGFTAGARDVYGEPPIIPPIKVVEGGNLRKEMENLLLRNTRTRELNALNLRARIGAANIVTRRVQDVIQQYGQDLFLAFQQELIAYVKKVIRDRLKELPDGSWYQEAFLDHDGTDNILYPMKLKMTKRADKLIFDFSGTSRQVPGPVNCTTSGLVGGVVSGILPMVCYDVPWTLAAVKELMEIISEPGTINNATYPAGCSMATLGACWMTTNLVNMTLGKMFACSPKYKREVQACWSPSADSFIINGLNAEGKPFTGIIMDGVAGGGGARSFKDGIDSGGYLCSTYISLPNAEVYENNYPILQLYRQQCGATAGPGKWRGGVGLQYAVIAHRNPGPFKEVLFCHGVSQPEARGIYGGFPSSITGHMILRNTDIFKKFSRQDMPIYPDQLQYERREVLPAKGVVESFTGPDVQISFVSGGGGYGDPLERDPARVMADVSAGLCSLTAASKIYGVVINPEGMELNISGTERERASLRQARLSQSRPVRDFFSLPPPQGQPEEVPASREVLFQIGDHMEVVKSSLGHFIVCRRCHYLYGPAHQDPKLGALVRETNMEEVSELNRLGAVDLIVFREFCCPGCGTLIGVDVQRRGDPLMLETELSFPES